jgi:hypothetical protein
MPSSITVTRDLPGLPASHARSRRPGGLPSRPDRQSYDDVGATSLPCLQLDTDAAQCGMDHPALERLFTETPRGSASVLS